MENFFKLPPGWFNKNNASCPDCETAGACQQWVRAAADDACVGKAWDRAAVAEWIAGRVLDGDYSHDTAITQIVDEYAATPKIIIQNARTYRGPGEYIGRPHPRFPAGSPLANPYREGAHGSRAEAIARFRVGLRRQWRANAPTVGELWRLTKLYQQNGVLTLICWCKPLACHGDVVAQAICELADDIPAEITDPRSRLLITGSREATPAMLAEARLIVAQAKDAGQAIVVGEAAGVDAEVIAACDRLSAPVEVYGGYACLRRRTAFGRNIVLFCEYPARDRAMVEKSDRVIAIWNGLSPGTRLTFEYARGLGVEVTVSKP